MKLAQLLLLSGVSANMLTELAGTEPVTTAADGAADGATQPAFKATDEEIKKFMPLFRQEMRRYENLPRHNKLKRWFNRYMRNGTPHQVKEMNKKMFEKGGAFDTFAGKDGQMNLEEATKMNEAMRKGFSEHFQTEVPATPKDAFKRMYDVYDGMSEGDGFSKKDARRGGKIMNQVRRKVKNWKPQKENLQRFRKLFKAENELYDEMDDDSQTYKTWQKWLRGNDKPLREMQKVMFAKGGPWDKFAGDDGVMDFDEMMKMDAAVREGMAKKGLKVPKRNDKLMKEMFEAYDGLTPKSKGVSKWGARQGGRIFNYLRDKAITEDEEDFYYPMASYIWDKMDDLDDDNKQKKYFFEQYLGKPASDPTNKKMMNAWLDAFGKYDDNKDHKLNRHEYMKMTREQEKEGEKIFGEGPEWTRGEKQFMYAMMDHVSEGRWNRWGKNKLRDGITKKDFRRVSRILRRDYEDIMESDSESDSDSDDKNEGGCQCFANGEENEAFCESGKFTTADTCTANGNKCHWGPGENPTCAAKNALFLF